MAETGLGDARKAAEEVIGALERCNRSEVTILQYRGVYDKFFDFLEREGVQGRAPSEGDCLAFVNVSTGASLSGLYEKSPSPAAGKVRRPLALLQRMMRDGSVDVCTQVCYEPWSPPTPFSSEYESYVAACRRRGNASATLRTKSDRVGGFLDWLADSGVDDLRSLTARDLTKYLLTLSHCKRRTVASVVGCLRDFLSFLEGEGRVEAGLAARLPRGRIVRNDSVPYLWSSDEIASLLAAIDRADAVGKRDYAMLLLVARLGLRASDLRRLELSSIDWHARELTVVQHKTGVPLSLPVLDDVGWAIIDYLKNGRPETECTRIFVKHVYPYDEFGDSRSLGSRLYRYASKAGIELPSGSAHGLHSLRGALARAMLGSGTPVATISEVLGHTDPATTESYYLRLDVDGLRRCALDVEDVIGGARE